MKSRLRIRLRPARPTMDLQLEAVRTALTSHTIASELMDLLLRISPVQEPPAAEDIRATLDKLRPSLRAQALHHARLLEILDQEVQHARA